MTVLCVKEVDMPKSVWLSLTHLTVQKFTCRQQDYYTFRNNLYKPSKLCNQVQRTTRIHAILYPLSSIPTSVKPLPQMFLQQQAYLLQHSYSSPIYPSTYTPAPISISHNTDIVYADTIHKYNNPALCRWLPRQRQHRQI